MGLKKFGEFEGQHNEAVEADKQNAWKILDEGRSILDVQWRGAGKWGTAGFVAVAHSEAKAWVAYLGVADDTDEKTDAISIANWGNTLPENEARAFFPKLKDIKYKEE